MLSIMKIDKQIKNPFI